MLAEVNATRLADPRPGDLIRGDAGLVWTSRARMAEAAAARVVSYVADHLGDQLSVGRIARACGLSARSLHRVTTRKFGVAPMVLVRRARLQMARAELEAPVPGTTVTTAAVRCGLTHLGRFSRDYALRFGEPPSQTLRRGRESLASGQARVRWPGCRGTAGGGPSRPYREDRSAATANSATFRAGAAASPVASMATSLRSRTLSL